jgi:hypothetical protein
MITKDGSNIRGTCNYEMSDIDFESSLVHTLYRIASIDHFVVACSPEQHVMRCVGFSGMLQSFVTTLQDDYKRW